MPNIRVKATLERISRELNQTGEHVIHHSGINPREAMLIDNLATDIAVTATQIAELARQSMGSSRKPGSLVRQTRRTLGFTKP
jgi:hypothetical protein